MPTNTGVTPVPIEKLGFRHLGIVDHPEDGTVWEWRLSER